MKIAIITMWYNEEFLAPFFLKHYEYVDRIHVIYDNDTTDDSFKIIRSAPNTTYESFKFPDMMDDYIKQNKLNQTIASPEFYEYDWIYILDADEFIWPLSQSNPIQFLSQINEVFPHCNVIHAAMWQVYKHISESKLDINKLPIYTQRRFGDTNRFHGFNNHWVKPCIIKPKFNIKLSPGNHKIVSGNKISMCHVAYDGAHWAMADVEMAIKRRVKDRKERQSQTNLQCGLTYHQHTITEQQIRNECEKHKNDPQLF